MQFGNVAEIAMILNAELVAFCSRQDDYASFTVAQQQHRAKTRKVPCSWSSTWTFFLCNSA